jgi:hypothetical protein
MPFTSTILMVRPASFGFNEQTAVNNSFQQKASLENIQQKALHEFDAMVDEIISTGIEVIVIEDTADPVKPDAIFPNNWFCTLGDGSVTLFPMYAKNRRLERRTDIVDQLKNNFYITHILDYSKHEEGNIFLEGTGSMVIDHEHKIIYACISERTHPELLHDLAKEIGYTVISFTAKDKKGLAIYHTNVLMCIGNNFCVICDEVIDAGEREKVFLSLINTHKQVVSISYDQMLHFAGNMLQIQIKTGEPILVMSLSAFNSLHQDQKEQLQFHTQLLPVNINTIETIGGGSARCMMAEIFLLGKKGLLQ